MTTPTFTTEAAEAEGRAAFARGDRRVCPIAPAPDRAVGADDGWAEQARAWYRGWDAANLAAPVDLDPEPTDEERTAWTTLRLRKTWRTSDDCRRCAGSLQ